MEENRIDDLDWNKYPIVGPASEAEAIESIDKFEENLRNGQVHWTSSEEFDRQLFEALPSNEQALQIRLLLR